MSEFQPQSPYDETTPPPDEAAFAGPVLREEQRVGLAAQHLLDSEAYALVTTAMQERVWEGFKACPMRDQEGLTHLKVFQSVIEQMHQMLEDAAATGKMAAIQLTEQQESSTPPEEV